MINQISPIPTDTTTLTGYNKDLLKARHIQARVKGEANEFAKPENIDMWDPGTIAPYVVSVIKWIE